jgi:hypothetical protein
MRIFLLGLAAVVAIAPAGLAIVGDIGVAPQQGILFGASELALAAMVVGFLYQIRDRLALIETDRLIFRLVVAVIGIVVGFIAYLLLYSHCVVAHPLYKDKLLFPLWASGKLAGMIRTAGSRYGAVDKYGVAAVFDAISEMPAYAYPTALAALLLLYTVPLAATGSLAFLLALRYPSRLFRRSATLDPDFDVFLCYNRADKYTVRTVARQLAANDIQCFLDENENPPGQVWTENVERALSKAPAFAIFLGPQGIGPWQRTEIQNISEARIERACNVIPVFLPEAPASARMPMQLAGLTWVDFRRSDPDPMKELIRGIRAPNPCSS